VQMTSFTREIKKLTKDWKTIIICAFINFIRLTLLYCLPFVIAKFMGIKIGWNLFLDVVALSSFVYMANSFIPIPGASGGTEVLFNIVFASIFGTLSSAVMILWRVSTYHIILVLGGIIFLAAKNHYDREEAKPAVRMEAIHIDEVRAKDKPSNS
jgi:hypothetical protein